MEKETYRFEMYASIYKSNYGEPIESKRGLTFYRITRQDAVYLAIGIVTGLRVKYKHPVVLGYLVNEDGSETLFRKQY